MIFRRRKPRNDQELMIEAHQALDDLKALTARLGDYVNALERVNEQARAIEGEPRDQFRKGK